MHYHKALGLRAGLTQQQLADLSGYEQSGAYSPIEFDVIRFAEQWSINGRVAEDVLSRLMEALSENHLVVLAAVVAQANLTCRFNNVFGVELP
jgi:hypothetical protein